MMLLLLWSLRATATILFGGLLVLALRRRSAAVRCLALRVTLVATWLLPAAVLFAPRIELALPKPPPSPLVSIPLPTAPSHLPEPSKSPVTSTGLSQAPAEIPSQTTPPPQPSPPVVSAQTMLVVIYIGGVLVLAVRWLAGLLRLRQIARRGEIVSPGIIRVADLGVPATFGFRQPAVLLPATSADWPEERIRAAILHEGAHIRRQDWLWQNLMTLFVTLHWFNPAAWLLARGLRDTAETATDDEVLSQGLVPSSYARELLAVAKHASPVGPAIAMARRGGVVDRVSSILDRDRDRRAPTRYLVAVLLISTALAGLALAGITGKRVRAGEAKPLRSGGTVEIVSVHEVDTEETLRKGLTWKPRRVWKPDGQPLPDDKVSYGFIAPKTDNYRPLLMEVKMSGVGREPVAAKILGDSSHSIPLFTGDDQSGNHDLRLTWRAPVNQPSQDVLLALATGDWKPYRGAKVAFKTSRRLLSTRGGEIPGIRIAYSFPTDLNGRNVRMKAVLKSGEREPIGATNMGPVPEKQTKPTPITMTTQIAGNDPKDVVGLEFDYRDYENVLFPGIALQPKGESTPPSVKAEVVGLGYPGGKAWRLDGAPDSTLKPPAISMPTVAGWRRLVVGVRLRGEELKEPWVQVTKWNEVLMPNRSDTFELQDIPGSPNEKIAWCSFDLQPEFNSGALGIDVSNGPWKIDADAKVGAGVELTDRGRFRRMDMLMHRYGVHFSAIDPMDLPGEGRYAELAVYGASGPPLITYLHPTPIGAAYNIDLGDGQKIRRIVLRSRTITHSHVANAQLWPSDSAKARLADGRTVELLALSKLDADPVATWSPDGTRPQVPPSQTSFDLRSYVQKGLQAHLRIAGAPLPGTRLAFRISYPSSVTMASPGFDGFENWYAYFDPPPAKVRKATLSVGVAFGPWRTVKRSVKFELQRNVEGYQGKPATGATILSWIAPPSADVQVRLAGFDRAGKGPGEWHSAGSIKKNGKLLIANSSDDPRARSVTRVELQERKICWTAFPSVAVVPRP